MNLLEIDRKFERINQREAELRYFYNPKAKFITGRQQHPYISLLRKDAKIDRKRYGMNPYITNEEFLLIRGD